MLYTLAHRFLASLKWISLAIVIAFLIGVGANIAVMKPGDFSASIVATILQHIFMPGLLQTASLIVVALIVLLSILAFFIKTREVHIKSDRGIRRYLQTVIEANQGLNPSGFAQQSQALISVNVPLNDIFIHLHAVPDRPIYDVPGEQQKLLEELRQRKDLKIEEREELIQRLRVIWYSQTAQAAPDKKAARNISIDDVLLQLTLTNPVAVILGTPGSGKSTILRWLALHMAHATLSPDYRIPIEEQEEDEDEEDENELRRIPVLLRISDYAKQLSKEEISYEQFFKKYIALTYPDLPDLADRLLNELAKGKCLVLLDGLDEVASDDLRRRIAQSMEKFIEDYAQRKTGSLYWNVFIITSRIVGYESGPFTKHAHYTLLDFEDEQIEQFLIRWCPAVERYQAMSAQGMKALTAQQDSHVKKVGNDQRDLLLRALANNASIKRLAVNPLMLTILALIQRSGKTLPHRRIELYQIVTRTLLDNWNKGSERRVFPVEEVPLAEQLLGNLAYQLHSSDPVLTEQDVATIAQRSMLDFYGQTNGQIRESDIKKFIETLRGSSGLFIESGQGLFNFMHRTFQEYFVAMYLLRKTAAELKQFVAEHYHIPIWREPLLLAIAYKNGQSSRGEKQEASDLIRTIKETSNQYDTVLQHNILFAANSVVDCNTWSIDKQLQNEIANQLFEIYGDEFRSGRYLRLQREIRKVTLLWLRGQPEESSQKNTLPPLLASWRDALLDKQRTERQKGAMLLLMGLASNLASCPDLVLHALLPPVIQITHLWELPYPAEIELPQGVWATLAAPQTEYFAWRLLDQPGSKLMETAYTAWQRWQASKPASLQLLQAHVEEREISTFRLNHLERYLLTRLIEREELQAAKGWAWQASWHMQLRDEMAQGRYATYQPALSLRLLLCEDDIKQRQELANEVVESLCVRDPRQLQALIVIMLVYFHKLKGERKRLAPYVYEEDVLWDGDYYDEEESWQEEYAPRVYPIERAWRSGSVPRLNSPGQSWERANFAFVYEGDTSPVPQIPPRRSTPSRRQTGATSPRSTTGQWDYPTRAVSSAPGRTRPLSSPRSPRVNVPMVPGRQQTRSLVADVPAPKRPRSITQRWRRFKRTARRIIGELRKNLPAWMPFAQQEYYDDGYELVEVSPYLVDDDYEELPVIYPEQITAQQRLWKETLALQALQHWFHIVGNSNKFHARDMEEFEGVLDSENILYLLCNLLRKPVASHLSSELLTLHILVANQTYLSPVLQKELQESLCACEAEGAELTTEQRILLAKLEQRLKNPNAQQEPPDKLALILLKSTNQLKLDKQQVENILVGCLDRRIVNFRRPVGSRSRPAFRTYQMVYQIAWDMLDQQFDLEIAAQEMSVQALDDTNAMVCAAAARLLQNSNTLQPAMREAATQKILQILSDDALSCRLLDMPDKLDWRLENILFDALQALAEQNR